MINAQFLITFYLIALFVDWVFQDDWQATNKSKWGKGDNKEFSLVALMAHSMIYAVLTTILGSMLIPINIPYLVVFWVLFLTHFIIDSRIPVKLIMKAKGMSNEQIMDYQNFGFMHIGIDHRLHELVLLVLACFA